MENYKLDEIDIKILNLLQMDGLMTYKEIAYELKKSITPIAGRIHRLRACGYIKRTVALVDIQKIRTAFIAFPHVQLNNHSEEALKEFQQAMVSFPEVMECYHLTGHFDFMLKVATTDMVAYNAFLRDKLDKMNHIVTIQSFLVLSAAKYETAYQLSSRV